MCGGLMLFQLYSKLRVGRTVMQRHSNAGTRDRGCRTMRLLCSQIMVASRQKLFQICTNLLMRQVHHA